MPVTPPPTATAQPLSTVWWVAGFLIAYSLVISLIPTSGNYLDMNLRMETDLTEGSIIRQVQLITLFLTAAILLYRHPAQTLIILKQVNPFLILLCLYCLITVIWSPFPVVTLKRVFVLLGLLVTAMATAPPLAPFQQLLRVLLLTLTIICTLSLVMAAILPAIGLDAYHDHALRGITWHKNLLGRIAAFATLLWLYEWTRNDWPRWWTLAGGLLTFAVLLLSRSSTALLLFAISGAVYLYWQRTWLQDRLLNPILFLSLGLVLVLATHFYLLVTGNFPSWDSLAGPISALFNKGTDLTGRTEIWEVLKANISQHPIKGIGYGAFWLGAVGPSRALAEIVGFMPAHGHNGYLDIFNELGLIGLLLFIATIVLHFHKLIVLRRYDRQGSAIHLAILASILTGNITETDLLSGIDFQNLLFLFSLVSVSAQTGYLRLLAGQTGNHSQISPSNPVKARPQTTVR